MGLRFSAIETQKFPFDGKKEEKNNDITCTTIDNVYACNTKEPRRIWSGGFLMKCH